MVTVQAGLSFDSERQLLVLPPGEHERGFGFAGWHDTVPAYRRFVLAHTRDRSRIVKAPRKADCPAPGSVEARN